MQSSRWLSWLAFALTCATVRPVLAERAARTLDVPTQTTIVSDAKAPATAPEIGSNGKTALPWLVVETPAAKSREVRSGRPFLTLSKAITWDPKTERHVAEFLFGLDAVAGGPGPLAQGLEFRFGVTCEEVSPNRLKIDTVGPLGYGLVTVSCSRQIKNESEQQSIQLFTAAGSLRYPFRIPRRQGALTLVAASERVLGSDSMQCS